MSIGYYQCRVNWCLTLQKRTGIWNYKAGKWFWVRVKDIQPKAETTTTTTKKKTADDDGDYEWVKGWGYGIVRKRQC